MAHRQSKARIEDKKIAKDDHADDQLLTAQGAQGDRSEYYKACVESINSIRPYFEHRALRRTIRSRSKQEESVWSNPNPTVLTLALKLHAHEYDVLEIGAQVARENSKKDTTWRSVRNIVIYTSFVC